METSAKELLLKEIRRDAILVVVDQDGERHEHEVNKAWLAYKSEYFEKTFQDPFNEKKTEFVVNCDAEGLASAVTWVMTGKVELTEEETVLAVLEVARYLLIDDLCIHCQQVMIGLLFPYKISETNPNLFLAVAGCSAGHIQSNPGVVGSR